MRHSLVLVFKLTSDDVIGAGANNNEEDRVDAGKQRDETLFVLVVVRDETER